MRKDRMAAAMIAAAVMMGMTGCKNQTAATETTKETVTEAAVKETETTAQEAGAAAAEGKTRIVKDIWEEK